MRPLRMVWLSSQVSGVCGAIISTSSSGFSLSRFTSALAMPVQVRNWFSI